MTPYSSNHCILLVVGEEIQEGKIKLRDFEGAGSFLDTWSFYGEEDNRLMIKCHASSNGEVHVSHKISPPFSNWNIEVIASQNFLELIECMEFRKEDYPEYNHKKGAGSRCDKPFPLGACSTFKFGLSY
ncbi:heavy metal-associated isoprenylated plant protein 41-like isoform X2 [Punica granatum]|uniref:Heavy metal-associated isoprenylated plant protein 41-like isoform X2 n=1 Tax=Punica granatum TaxID=22663 RepID=A0A6P8EEN7_PUNGR|nr:heavy metal-associated isoprenylated plant protein 41-like isoform X2 [Punica granatum]